MEGRLNQFRAIHKSCICSCAAGEAVVSYVLRARLSSSSFEALLTRIDCQCRGGVLKRGVRDPKICGMQSN